MASVVLIIPTLNERANIPELARRIFSVAKAESLDMDVLVVDDDSPDGTGEVVKREAEHYHGRLRLLERRGPRGLALSVLDGIAATKAPTKHQ